MFRVNWRKLFFAGAIITIVGVAIQIYTTPYPLTGWIPEHPVTFSSYNPLNSTMILSETLSLARIEQLEPVPITPDIVLNASTELNQEEGNEVSQKRGESRRRRKTMKQDVLLTSFPPSTSPSPRGIVPSRSLRYIWSLTPDEALLYAKKEIQNASIVTDETDLYAPLFRNVSVFRRSYELMELILKVYIYKEGARPIFHQPYLKGIYSSEGWFMKLMAENRQFVTRDPEKAHLFYLSYSARQLEKALYVPNSHNMKPLSYFLRDYVNMIAAKYPFWNRTHGSNHFLVACHDWGPYTLTEHNELRTNPIKALCNADVSEGVFIAGKDVSLPETTIRNPRKPLTNLGGRRVSQRPILAFFAGKMHGRVRPKLLKFWRNKSEDMRIYGPLPKVSKIMSYVQFMKLSKYCICPMGYEVNSPRIVEAIYYECVPVIIADNFVLPFNEVLNWNAFSVIVAEKDIPKLRDILLAIPLRRYVTMQTNVKMLQRHFHWNRIPIRYDLFHMILHSIWFSQLNQIEVPQSS
ncbi:probable glycosyltransferase At5g03795 [Cornus florida]|uniref:probable glycosyltransferase At5g03795 n=1 Tax=Cornus florida TaxID=4283 RepID=UPI0028965900|nr:probable glycosyltransferase At5g03795 [Cornus florida]